MNQRLTLINGDGIGAEVIPAARQVIEAFQLPIDIQAAAAGFAVFQRYGDALPRETLALCEQSDAVLFGATQSPMTTVVGYQSPILNLRQHFELFANVRPAISQDRNAAIDMLIVRENTEGLYSRRERVEQNGAVAITERVITEQASRRIVQFACKMALQRRKKLTLVHKANVLKATCGLFRDVAWDVANGYPELTVDELLVDAAAMFMVQNPSRFDVIVTTNLFGDILSDLAAGLTGGLGIAPSGNVGSHRPALFEPVHGSAPDIAGQGIADPRAAILSAAMALEFLSFQSEAEQLRQITYATPHQATTRQTTALIVEKVARGVTHVA